MLGEVGQQLGDDVDRAVEVGGDGRRRARVAGVTVGAAELLVVDVHTGELGHHRRSTDEGVGGLGHHHMIGDAQEEGGARYGRTVEDEEGGHDPGTVGERLGRPTPPVEGGEALDDVGTAGAQDAHEGNVDLARGDRGMFECGRRIAGERASPVLGIDLDPNHLAALEVAHEGMHGAGHLGAQSEIDHRPETRQCG